jgi:enoyl-CoA hydratase/carnithine racemase
MDAEVVVERTGRRVDIVLNRPERRNAVTRTLAV